MVLYNEAHIFLINELENDTNNYLMLSLPCTYVNKLAHFVSSTWSCSAKLLLQTKLSFPTPSKIDVLFLLQTFEKPSCPTEKTQGRCLTFGAGYLDNSRESTDIDTITLWPKALIVISSSCFNRESLH